MGAPVVVFDSVWKKFRRGERHDSLRDLIPAALRRTLRRAPDEELSQREFWALENVSFEVHAGQALGIIGPNGAGKSTILKVLTRILRPTRGACLVRGRVGALIEVAAGFHPDLTGRENIFLQGAIMGMRRTEIARKLEEIVEFAGVRDFIDTPVKRYSSGMNARLGFSIAAHLDPEVLIIDEVLSVGDSAFQDRCVKRMEEFKRQGVTIVFVSHNLQSVAALCDRAVLLQRQVQLIGTADEVLHAYVQNQSASSPPSSAGPVHIVGARLNTGTGSDALKPGQAIELEVDCVAEEVSRNLIFGIMVYRSTDRLLLYEGHFASEELGVRQFESGEAFTMFFDFAAHFVRGEYFVECWILHGPTHIYWSVLSPAALFSVDEARTTRGIVDIGISARLLPRPSALTAGLVRHR